MSENSTKQSVTYAEVVINVHGLADFDAVEVHGVRVNGPCLVIDDATPEFVCTYFRKKAASDPLRSDHFTSQRARCGDFRKLWAAQEYAAELSDATAFR